MSKPEEVIMPSKKLNNNSVYTDKLSEKYNLATPILKIKNKY